MQSRNKVFRKRKLNMDRNDHLRTYTAIVEQQGISAAAQKLGLTKGTVSKQLASLEHILGVELLHRGTHTIQLSEAGHLFYRQCQIILSSVQETEELLLGWKQKPKGTLKVLAGRHFAYQYITPFLHTFFKQFPEIILNIELGERMADLQEEGIDIMVGMSIAGPEDYIQKRLLSTRYAYCASPTYLLKHGPVEKPGDLTRQHYITHSMRKPVDQLQFDDGVSIVVNPVLYSNDADQMLQAALQGIGVVKLHHYVVAESLANGTLVEVLRDYNTQELSLYLCYRNQKYLAAPLRAFIQFVEKNIENIGGKTKSEKKDRKR